MSNVKAFVDRRNRSTTITDTRRKADGEQYRVAVPPTRFNHAVQNQVESKSNVSLFNVATSTLKLESVNGREVDAFDTDAGSLDDTTSMSISTKSNGHPQAVQLQDQTQNFSHKANARSQVTHHASRGHEASDCFGTENNASDDDDEGSGESDEEGSQAGYSVTASLIDDFQSPEYAEFKRQNPLDGNFTQAFQPFKKPPTGSGVPASKTTPVNARQITGPLRSTSSFSTRQHDSREIPQTLQHELLDKQQMESSPLGGPLRRVRENVHAPDSLPITIQDHALPAGEGIIRQIPCRTPKSIRQVSSDVTHGTAEPRPAFVRSAGETVIPRRTDSSFGNHPFTVSELSNDDNVEKVADIRASHTTFKRRRIPDHSSDQLTTMTFQQLRDEPFDLDANKISPTLSPNLNDAPLHTILEYLFSMEDKAGKDDQQQTFFISLAIDQYAECGDVIGTKLNDAISKLNNLRKQKRMVAGQFEEEIARREDTIRTRTTALKKEKVVMMRQTEELMAGKTP